MKMLTWAVAILFTIAAGLESAAASGLFDTDTTIWEALRLQIGYTFALFQSGAVNMVDTFAIRQAQIEYLDNLTEEK